MEFQICPASKTHAHKKEECVEFALFYMYIDKTLGCWPILKFLWPRPQFLGLVFLSASFGIWFGFDSVLIAGICFVSMFKGNTHADWFLVGSETILSIVYLPAMRIFHWCPSICADMAWIALEIAAEMAGSKCSACLSGQWQLVARLLTPFGLLLNMRYNN